MFPWLTPWNIADLDPDELQALFDDVAEMNRQAKSG